MSHANLFYNNQKNSHKIKKKLAIHKAHLSRMRKYLPINHKGDIEAGVGRTIYNMCMWDNHDLCDQIARQTGQHFKNGFTIKILLNYLGSQAILEKEENYCKSPNRNVNDNCMCHQIFSDTFASKQSDGNCPSGYIHAVGNQCYKQHQPMHEFGMCDVNCASCIKDESEQTDNADQPSDVCAMEQVPQSCISGQKCSETEGNFWLALSKMSCHCRTLKSSVCASDHACTWMPKDTFEASVDKCAPYEGQIECERKCSVDTDKTSWECGCICGAIIAHEANAANKVCPHETSTKSDLNSWLRATGKPALYNPWTRKYEFNIWGRRWTLGSPGMQCHKYRADGPLAWRRYRDWVQGNYAGPYSWYTKRRWKQYWSRAPQTNLELWFMNRKTSAYHWCREAWTSNLRYRNWIQWQHPFFKEYAEYAFDGCMDSSADNYDSTAVYQPASSCIFYGCKTPGADNYDTKVTHPDGSCIFYGCTDSTAGNYDSSANHDDGSCIFNGCTYSSAFNYNAAANTDDDSCIFNCTTDVDCPDYDGQEQYCLVSTGECSTVEGSGGNDGELEGCTDPNAKNYNDAATHPDGSCIAKIEGCTYSSAFNYNATANTDDDSCIFNCTTDVDCPDYDGQEQYCLVSAGQCSTVENSGGDI